MRAIIMPVQKKRKNGAVSTYLPSGKWCPKENPSSKGGGFFLFLSNANWLLRSAYVIIRNLVAYSLAQSVAILLPFSIRFARSVTIRTSVFAIFVARTIRSVFHIFVILFKTNQVQYRNALLIRLTVN